MVKNKKKKVFHLLIFFEIIGLFSRFLCIGGDFVGPVELAAVGVSIALFNQVSRIAIFPLVSITTSFVAEEDACNSQQNTVQDHKECIETGTNNAKEETQKLIPENSKGIKLSKDHHSSVYWNVIITWFV